MKKVAMITGASRGIGAACARKFGKAGYHLVLCCRKQVRELEQLAQDIREDSGVCVTVEQGDVADPDFVDQMVSRAIDRFGQIDVLINNAGISVVGLLQDMTNEQWGEIVGTNLSAVFYACRAVLPAMTHRMSGRIINISSVWGTVGASCEVAYSATKGGVNTFTKALAKELAPSGIAVNAIACGAIDTSMNSHLTEEEKRMVEEEIPFGRYGTLDEAAECALGLAGMPAYLTGQIIGFDGGWQS